MGSGWLPCKWLPWGLLCGTSGTSELYMVPCHSCHFYGYIGKQEQKGGGKF